MNARWLPLAAFGAIALAGPLFVGPADAPAIRPSAAQLLPPFTVVTEVPVAGGGIVRAVDLRVDDGAIALRSAGEWTPIPAIRAAGAPRTRTLWLGSDHQGRDVLARAVHGATTSLAVAALALALALSLGVTIGLGAAVGSAPAGRAFLRTATDGALAIPRLLLVLIFAVSLRGSPAGTALAIGIVSWMDVARLVEARAQGLIGLPFVESVVAGGASPLRLALRHLLPNLAPVLLAVAPVVAAEAVLLESTLSFLGAGSGAASWGAMVADSQRFLPGCWWMAVVPGALLSATALAFHVQRPGRPEIDRQPF